MRKLYCFEFSAFNFGDLVYLRLLGRLIINLNKISRDVCVLWQVGFTLLLRLAHRICKCFSPFLSHLDLVLIKNKLAISFLFRGVLLSTTAQSSLFIFTGVVVNICYIPLLRLLHPQVASHSSVLATLYLLSHLVKLTLKCILKALSTLIYSDKFLQLVKVEHMYVVLWDMPTSNFLRILIFHHGG